jgi:hypothetical protein
VATNSTNPPGLSTIQKLLGSFVNFRVARQPGVIAITSHMPTCRYLCAPWNPDTFRFPDNWGVIEMEA